MRDRRRRGAARATIPASYLSDAPNNLIHAVARITEGTKLVRIQFAGEPGAHRWFFHRYGDFVDIEILSFDEEHLPDRDGLLAWSTHRPPVADLATACASCFTGIRDSMGEDRYERSWGFPFPATSLAILTTALGGPPGVDDANVA